MTQYFCRKCNTNMEVTDEDVGAFKQVMKCPRCGMEIIADHGDADPSDEVWGAEVPTVWPKAGGGAEGLEPPHHQVWREVQGRIE